MYVINKTGRQIKSILTRTIETEIQNGEQVLRFSQRYDSPTNGSGTDISVVRRNNLEPLSYRAELSGEKEEFTFTPQLVKGTVTPTKSEAKIFNVALKESIFNAVVSEDILQTLPLRACLKSPRQIG